MEFNWIGVPQQMAVSSARRLPWWIFVSVAFSNEWCTWATQFVSHRTACAIRLSAAWKCNGKIDALSRFEPNEQKKNSNNKLMALTWIYLVSPHTTHFGSRQCLATIQRLRSLIVSVSITAASLLGIREKPLISHGCPNDMRYAMIS